MEQFHTSIGLSPNDSILSNGYMYLVPYIAGDLDPVESNRSFYVHLYLDQDPGSDAKFSKAFMKNVLTCGFESTSTILINAHQCINEGKIN